MILTKCSLDDVASIQKLYQHARALQQEKQMVVWPLFSDFLIDNAIRQDRQWKLVLDDTMACCWTITFNDKEIWQERDRNDAIYIHRIATDPAFRGRRFIHDIVAWSKDYAQSAGRRFVRLDTIGNNEGLIKHYVSAGFSFLGATPLVDADGLPDHYQVGVPCCRFELTV